MLKGNIIILGSSGQLGSEFYNFFQDYQQLFTFSHKGLDITELDTLITTFAKIKPTMVINCTAYTQVDKAEEERDKCYLVNSLGARNVAYASFLSGSKIVYFSTDYVFDGRKNEPYREYDQPNPLSIYGWSKLLGEQYTSTYNPNHLIIRTSWLYGIQGKNFIKTVLNHYNNGKHLEIVDDQYGCPTYARDLVQQTVSLLKNDEVGLFHAVNSGVTNWYQLAVKVFDILEIEVAIKPIKTGDFPARAKRPSFSVLENYHLNIKNLNLMRDCQLALKDFLLTNRRVLVI